MNNPFMLYLYEHRPYLAEKIVQLLRYNKIINIYGSPGIGKTTICNFCLEQYFRNTNQIIIDPDKYNSLFEYNWKENCIYIFEDCDDINLSKEIIRNINSSNPYTKFIFISRNRIKQLEYIGAIEIEVPPFNNDEIFNLFLKRIYYEEGHNKIMIRQKIVETLNAYNGNILQRRIMEITNGNPLFINLMIDLIIKNDIKNIDQIIRNGTINFDTYKTIYKPCIIDQFGKPIEKIDNSTKIIVTEINDELLFELSQNPRLLYSLLSYDFERVIARMFEKKGFTVKITPQSRDGGKDIFIAKNDLCSFLFYVECKKYAPQQHVGIDVIQRLYGVVSAEKATGGIIATTSYFTKPAKNYIKENHIEHQLTLQDYDTISNILQSLQYNTQ